MLRKIAIVILMAALSAPTALFAQSEQSGEEHWIEKGDTGYFSLDALNHEGEIIIWENPVGATMNRGLVSCSLTDTTEISVLNSDLDSMSRAELRLMNGNEIFMFAKIKVTGRGEGTQSWCEEIVLYRPVQTSR